MRKSNKNDVELKLLKNSSDIKENLRIFRFTPLTSKIIFFMIFFIFHVIYKKSFYSKFMRSLSYTKVKGEKITNVHVEKLPINRLLFPMNKSGDENSHESKLSKERENMFSKLKS